MPTTFLTLPLFGSFTIGKIIIHPGVFLLPLNRNLIACSPGKLLQMVDFRMRNLNISIYHVVYINGKIKLLLGMFTHFCSCGFLDKQYHFTVYVGKCKFSPFLISRRVFKALSNMYAKLFYENSEKLSGHQPITIFVKKLHRSCFIES